MADERDLADMEEARLRHVADAIRGALATAGLPADLPVDVAARAAIAATERFPADGWPFGRDLNRPPAGIRPSTARAFQEIDAAVFSGEMLVRPDHHLYLAAHAQRWSKAATAHRVEIEAEPEAGPAF